MLKENKPININKHPLLKKCYEVCGAIEASGASKELTKASTLANELFKDIDYYVTLIQEINKEANEYSIFRDGASWCATRYDFINIQESPAGFGCTPIAALTHLHTQLND